MPGVLTMMERCGRGREGRRAEFRLGLEDGWPGGRMRMGAEEEWSELGKKCCQDHSIEFRTICLASLPKEQSCRVAAGVLGM